MFTGETQHILYLNYDKCIMDCKLDGTEKKKHMKYSTTAQPFAVVKGKGILFLVKMVIRQWFLYRKKQLIST